MSAIDLATAQKEGYVIGLKEESGMYLRREIDDLMVNDPDCFNLYVLALERIMRDEGQKQNKMHYFQIAGIHGLPLIDWDGVKNPTAGKRPGSYCTHASALFPSWHRPYLAMMEQTLYSNMKDIASQFEDRKYLQAVERFRLPFWDWIKPRGNRSTSFPGIGIDGSREVTFPFSYDLPAVLVLPTLRVYRPETPTKLVDIVNPFTRYIFPSIGSVPKTGPGSWKSLQSGDDQENATRRAGDGVRVYASDKRTVRNPTSNPTSDGDQKDDIGEVNKGLNMLRESSVESALNLITHKSYDNYINFATERVLKSAGERVGPFGSLEDLHNQYHGMTGGDGGHMSRVPVSSFDPVFWLHHCNIDRILTVWQAVHSKESYLPLGKDIPKDRLLQNGNYGRDRPLWPFRKDGKNSFWDSADVQDHTVFGYTYADVQGLPADHIKKRWSQSYYWSIASNNKSAPPKWMQPISVGGAQVFKFSDTTDAATPALTTMATLDTILSQKAHAIRFEDGKPLTVEHTEQTTEPIESQSMPEPVVLSSQIPEVVALMKDLPEAEPIIQWYIDVEVQRDAFDGAFRIFYFLSDSTTMAEIDADPLSWSTAHTLAGSTHVFTAPKEACDACNVNAAAGIIVTGTTPITPMLRDCVRNARLLEGLAPAQVVPFLKKNLYVRVKAINNIVVDHEDMPFLKIGVSSVIAAQREGEGVPLVSETRDWPEVVEGRRGGDPVA